MEKLDQQGPIATQPDDGGGSTRRAGQWIRAGSTWMPSYLTVTMVTFLRTRWMAVRRLESHRTMLMFPPAGYTPLWNFTHRPLVDPPARYAKGKCGAYGSLSQLYTATRATVLSSSNLYFSKSDRSFYAGWPASRAWRGCALMAAMVAALTAFEGITGLVGERAELEEAVSEQLRSDPGLDSGGAGSRATRRSDGWNENQLDA